MLETQPWRHPQRFEKGEDGGQQGVYIYSQKQKDFLLLLIVATVLTGSLPYALFNPLSQRELSPEEEDANKTIGVDSRAPMNHLRETDLRLRLSLCNSENDDEHKAITSAKGVSGFKRVFSQYAMGLAEPDMGVVFGLGNPWPLLQLRTVGAGLRVTKGIEGVKPSVTKMIISDQKEKTVTVSELSPPTPATQRSHPVIVGWPPVRASRKNLNLQPRADMEKEEEANASSGKTSKKGEDGLFVKVNMDGFPIGRKVNLKAYDDYVSLSQGLQQLFSRFLDVEIKMDKDRENAEHVLVYEDNDGDRMLVGDVPWEMFMNTVKRLWIINGSEAPTIAATRTPKG